MVRCNTACRAVIGCHILSCFCIDCRSHIVGHSVHIQSQSGRSVLHNLTFHLGSIFVNINNVYILQMCHILIKSITFCQCRGEMCIRDRNTAESFSVIQRNSFSIQNSIEELTSNTTDLRNSNQAISDSVQTISAVSEELTAHASETMDAETVNTQILENIAAKMKSLVQYIQKQ